jgi:sugar phosphate isomerase/epimerase
MMQLSLCPQPFAASGLEAALDAAVELGVAAIELPVNSQPAPFVDLDELLAGGCDRVLKAAAKRGLAISAISLHQDGQLLLGPHHRDTDAICPGTPDQKVAFANERLTKAAQLAGRMGVPALIGFVGCEDQTRLFPWPDPQGWERMLPTFRERVLPVLDECARCKVRFGQEPHPKQMVYNTETALESVRLLDGHPAWGFNLDPANLLLAGVDAADFAQALEGRVVHVHAKDGELVPHNRRSGLLAHGPWDRKDRGFRFRVAGWGDVPWKRLISELVLTNFSGFLALENEDPVFEPMDGLKKAVATLAPLLPKGERRARWW